MSIVRLQHIGVALSDYQSTASALERIGLPPRDFRNDQGKGFQHDARVLLGNECWLHIVYNWNPESRVNRFLQSRGPGLEHLALESNDIEEDVARLRKLGVPIFEDRIFDANDGFEAFVYPDDAIGFTVELIQPHATSWTYPVEAEGRPVSDRLGTVRARRVGASVEDVRSGSERFCSLFGLSSSGSSVISLGNVELSLDTSKNGRGLRYVEVETEKGASSEPDVGFSVHLVGP